MFLIMIASLLIGVVLTFFSIRKIVIREWKVGVPVLILGIALVVGAILLALPQ